MDNAYLDCIMDGIIHLPPIFAKKLMKADLSGIDPGLSRLQFTIMGVLSGETLSVSELAKILLISKPQMTHLVNQLVKKNVIERQPDARDRRVINLSLTQKGKTLRHAVKQKILDNARDVLAGLTTEELKSMAEALETLRNIGAKL